MKFTSIILIVLCALGCAQVERKEQNEIRTLFEKKLYKEARESLDNSTLKKEERNRLLFLMERGRILFAEQKYSVASDTFQAANDLVDKLYTKKVTQELLSATFNDTKENYYGSILERSMLYYYLALSNLKVFESGMLHKEILKDGKATWSEEKLNTNDRRNHLFRARAAVVAWNGFFEEIRRVNKETTLYQADLNGKLFAAAVHELVGDRSDLNIALQLYKDALGILKIQGPSYKQFNAKFKEYSKNIYESLDKGKVDPKQQWVELTPEYQKLEDYIQFKILSMTKKLRSREYKKTVGQIKPTKNALEMVNTDANPNTIFVIEKSVVVPMEAEEFDYSINSAVENMENGPTKALVEGIGLPVLTLFAMGPLGLGFVGQTGNTYIYTQHNLGTQVMRHIGIGFEMPVVKDIPTFKSMELQFYQGSGDKKKLVKSVPLVISGPVDDLAMQAASERAAASFTKVGVRVAVKHIAAIAAAFQTYNTMKKQSGEFVAKAFAYTQYMASSKAIASSEKADIRYWSTLPGQIRQVSLSLPPGEYEAVCVTGDEKKKSEKSLGKVNISENSRNFFSYRM